jgi:drug/metabolite transporter (DMT)-like permease
MTSRAATSIGLFAVLLWSLLALFTAGSGTIPPFQLAAMTFVLGGLVGIASWMVRPRARSALHQPPVVWALGIGGLFGYHALYFAALRVAPPAEAGLICYLWPLLIVLFSSLLPGERLRAPHVAGALLGFSGVAILIAGRGALDVRPEYWPGYAAAFAAAFVWAGYSVLSRRFGEVPTDVVAGFCLGTAALSLVCHVLFETTVWPHGAEWLAVVALGLGPVGAAFYVWDIGMKRGDIRLLGVASYAAPVLSTLVLVATGYAEPTIALGIACALIVVGALVAALAPGRTALQRS